MMLRPVAAALAASLVLAPLSGWSQQKGGTEPTSAVAPRPDRSRNIELLLEALKVAPDEQTAKPIEERIFSVWAVSGSDTADLLMTRAKFAIEKKDHDLALSLLNAIIDLKPDFAEAWNRRATVYFLMKDYGRSLSDLREVLIREPRHFGALAGLGTILNDLGDETRALDAFRRALALNPHLKGIPERVKELTGKVEGRDI